MVSDTFVITTLASVDEGTVSELLLGQGRRDAVCRPVPAGRCQR
jgi:hypothetical protein